MERTLKSPGRDIPCGQETGEGGEGEGKEGRGRRGGEGEGRGRRGGGGRGGGGGDIHPYTHGAMQKGINDTMYV